MPHYNQQTFIPKHPEKYIGTTLPFSRSSWELCFMNICDQHPNIMQWSSESVNIPYYDPITGKKRNYIPDFLIMYKDKDGVTKREMIEIKPMRQTMIEAAKSKSDKLAIINNQAKWKAATAWCLDRGLTFRVITEHHLYRNTGKV
jgi:hypothetical protein